MKKILTLALLIISINVFAQDSLKTFNESRSCITTTGIEVLGSWGIVNIGTGAVGLAKSRGGENKYFHQMNLIWGATNLGISILGYTGVQRKRDQPLTREETVIAQQKIEKTFLINGGLDLVYIGVGTYLYHRGDTHTSAQLRGYGSSVILQGAFLLLFDATMYNAERHNGNKLRRFLEKNPVTFNGKSIGILYSLN